MARMRTIPVLRATLALAILASASTAKTPGPKLKSGDVRNWRVESVPAARDSVAWRRWERNANWSSVEWSVTIASGAVVATQLERPRDRKSHGLPFEPVFKKFRTPKAWFKVDNGWLVAFNRGEFGKALCWFSPDGARAAKISNHQVVAFTSTSDGIFAIEGLAHLGRSRGTLIRLRKGEGDGSWIAEEILRFPGAPRAISVRKNEKLLVTLDDGLVQVDLKPKVTSTNLLTDAGWGGLYPNSSVLSHNETSLFIGMRTYVGEYDLTKKRLRYLAPPE